MKMIKDLVSIIIPVYNAEKYIYETLDTVRAQTYENWELLIVDDCGTDGTMDKVEDYMEMVDDERIRIIRLPQNMGAAIARNKGVYEAQGQYIAYLDADDLWVPDKLEKEIAFMKEKEAAFVYSGYEFANEKGEGTGKVVRVPETLVYKEALKNTTIFTSTVIFDTERINKKLLEMPVIESEDTALWWKVLRCGFVAYGLDENLVKYRRVGKSLSANKIRALYRIWYLYRRAEGLSLKCTMYNFCFWAYNAVLRRV